MKKLILPIVILIVIFFLLNGWWGSQLAAVNADKQSFPMDKSTKIFVVSKGESFSQVANELKKQDLIKSSWVFTLYGKQSGLAGKIQAGTFRLSPSQSSEQILKVLTNNPLDIWVTLIEGWRVEEMAEKLNGQLGIDNGEFIKIAKEGYMFPDTYLSPKDYNVSQIAKKLRDTFDLKFTQDLKDKIKARGLTENQGVILASIVEREARSDKARMEIASILLKRFKIGMGLNADATIQYALGYQPSEKSWWKRNLSDNDLKINSPYNTYIHSGLPPTPICNPGISALKAVANADPQTPYLYYYHDSKGNSYYAKDLEEHNANVANHP